LIEVDFGGLTKMNRTDSIIFKILEIRVKLIKQEKIMKVEIRQVDGLAMIGKGESNHWVVTDTAKIYKGHDAGTRPMELVLIALGGCAAMDIISLLRKKNASLENLKVEIDAERAKDHPRVFTNIKANFIFYGKEVKEEDVEWAVNKTFEKYCPVAAMLAEVSKIDYSWQVLK